MQRAVVFVTLVAALAPACKKVPEPNAAPASSTAAVAPSARANEPAPAPAERGSPSEQLARPLLWAVEKAGNTTYFLGTMHAGVDADSLPALVWNKLHDAKTFAMEADLDDPAAAAVLRPTTSSLRDALGADYWKKLEAAMGPNTARAIEYMPPLVPAAQLSLRGLPATPAMDKALSARAVGQRKQIVFLEPATRQLEILGKWMDIKALRLMLDELPEGERRARAMLAAYVAGDDKEIVAIADRERESALRHGYTAAEYEEEMRDMLYDRNASWIDTLERLHAEGGAFVAVGAMHLVGSRSVLELLEHKGYRVRRVAP
jgi:uncharacterized protein YbaP (TraB family)